MSYVLLVDSVQCLPSLESRYQALAAKVKREYPGQRIHLFAAGRSPHEHDAVSRVNADDWNTPALRAVARGLGVSKWDTLGGDSTNGSLAKSIKKQSGKTQFLVVVQQNIGTETTAGMIAQELIGKWYQGERPMNGKGLLINVDNKTWQMI